MGSRIKQNGIDLDHTCGGLDFYRLKDREAHVQVEFNQTVYKNQQGKVVVENHV